MSMTENIALLHEAIADRVPEERRAELEKFLTRIMGHESSGKLHAKNENSSATGIFQFTKGTWAGYGKGKDIFNAKDQCEAVVRLALDNRNTLVHALGREPTAGEYYLAHFAGDTTALKILRADPSTPIENLMRQNAIDANSRGNSHIYFRGKSFENFTADDLVHWSAAVMDANVAERRQFQQNHDAGKTTKEQDEKEEKDRTKLLQEFGVPEELIKYIESMGILGQLFLAVFQMYVDKATPAADRAPDNSADIKTPPAPVQQKNTTAQVRH